MLQKIRDSLQTQRWFGIAILGAIALVFVAWGAYGIVDVGFGGGNYAAKVNGEKISIDEASRAWLQQQTQWQQAFGGEIPAERRKELQAALLDALVREKLLTERTGELGYRVSEQQLDRAVAAEPAFQVDGKFSAQLAKARLAQAGLAEHTFYAELRQGLERQQIRAGLQVSSFLTPAEVARLLALEDEQRELRYALLPVGKFAGSEPIADTAIREYYDGHRSEFMTPESVRLQYGELRLEQLASQVVVGDKELHELYDKSKDTYAEAEKRHARHILLATPDKAQQVLAEARAGGDFAALAKKYSQDSGSAPQGGDLGWADRKAFVAPFSEALFAMTPGEIRGPVHTQFGEHIIKLEGVQPGKTRSFEEVRPELEAQVRRDRAADLFGDTQEAIQRRLEDRGVDLETLAREFHLQLGEVADFTREGGGAPLGADQELRDVVFSDSVLAERRIGGPVPLGDDRLVLVKVLEHRRPAAKPLEAVRAQIVATLRAERGAAAARAAAAAALKRLDSGESFDAVVAGLGITAEPARFIGRSDPSVPAQLRERAFQGPKPAQPVRFSLALEGDGAAIGVVTRAREGQGGENPALRAQRVQQLTGRRAMGEFTAYVDEMRRRARVETNPKAFE
ncbi:MAG: SurA N-terminal domain-containing protein [Gammaproteobacteria bacterium]|nr:SurA N-terminal domain-containing protein [Gammaproteobacteria bacterium]